MPHGPGLGPPGTSDVCARELAKTGGGSGGQAGCGPALVWLFASGYWKNPALAGLDAATFSR